MSHPFQNAAAQSGFFGTTVGSGGSGSLSNQGTMLGTNQTWSHGAQNTISADMFRATTPTLTFTVEQVDNGYVISCVGKRRICKDVNELKDMFVAIMVENKLEK